MSRKQKDVSESKDMSEWKVVYDLIWGDLGPRQIASNEGHEDNTLDWKKFHAKFPELAYFTQDMIDLDSDAFKEDKYYAWGAKNLLPYLDPFVDFVASLSASEAEQRLLFFREDIPRVQRKLRYLKDTPVSSAILHVLRKFMELINSRPIEEDIAEVESDEDHDIKEEGDHDMEIEEQVCDDY